MRTEEEIDVMIENMIKRTKGRYLTQGVSFNKTCPRQMKLLKKALMSSVSFSGLAKEMLALRFDNDDDRDVKFRIDTVVDEAPIVREISNVVNIPKVATKNVADTTSHPKLRSYGNFI